jgi:hypothetical protein
VGADQPLLCGFGLKSSQSFTVSVSAERFSQDDKDALAAFLLTLTDNRVACHSSVFDHPELVLFMGNQDVPASTGSPVAQDIKVKLPAVGKSGLSTCFPNTGSLFGQLQDFFMSIVTPVP